MCKVTNDGSYHGQQLFVSVSLDIYSLKKHVVLIIILGCYGYTNEDRKIDKWKSIKTICCLSNCTKSNHRTL